jgi:hypothetical protein
MHTLQIVLGLDNANSPWYLFWSGVGGYGAVLIGGIIGFIKLKKQRNHHHEQLKRHIDYKFSKLTDEETT